jgi:hypothetical protein
MKTSHKHLRVLRYPNILFLSMISLVVLVNLALPVSLRASQQLLHRSFSPPVFDHKEDAKGVVNKLVAEDFEGIRKNFNAQLKAALSAEKMKDGWTAIGNQLGKYKSQGQPHSGPGPGGYDIVIIRCQMDKGELDIEVDYDSDGLIGGLWLRPLT